jgi:NAD(P)-dependent dehydrogenase (short-subunit alcohol dehydrogenase family)
MNTAKVALVTGISSGIGRETAKLLASRGWRVFGTTRGAAPAGLAGVDFVRLDVTDDAQVSAAVRAVMEKAGRLDALVNNAGNMLLGGAEETSVAEARAQFETNLFGTLRMINAVLPVMRAQGSGRIVNVGSVLGFLPGPYMALYTASKHAIEGYTETLDHEIREFGLRAVLVEPSFTHTKLGSNAKHVAASIPAYAETKRRVLGYVSERFESGDDPADVAKVVVRAVTDASPRSRYQVGDGVKAWYTRRLLPPALFAPAFRKMFRLDV